MKNEKPHISASAIVTYTKCGLQFERRYVRKEILPPAIAMHRGTALHRGQEINYAQKIKSHKDLPKKDVIDASASRFEDGIKADGILLSAEEESVGKDKVVGETKDQIVSMATCLSEAVMPKVQPVAVEEKQVILLPGEFPNLLGFVDVVDIEEYIRDLKTSSKAKNQAFWDADVQMSLYALFYRAKYGKDAEGIWIDQIVGLKKGAEYVPVLTKRTDADFKALLFRINAVVKGIQAGVFIPAVAGSWWCSPKWCGFFRTCKAVNSNSSTED